MNNLFWIIPIVFAALSLTLWIIIIFLDEVRAENEKHDKIIKEEYKKQNIKELLPEESFQFDNSEQIFMS